MLRISRMMRERSAPQRWPSLIVCRRISRLCLCACLLSIVSNASAQQPTATSTSSVPVIEANTNLVLLDVLVSQRKTGKLNTSLKASDFSLTEDGAPQKIRYFSQDKLPLSIVLMFDLTYTVHPMLKPLAASALQALQHLKPQDEVAVMTFSSSAQMLQPFTTDRAAAAAAIEKAAQEKSSEATFLDEDVFEGAEAAANATIPNSRRVLVFFTDGTANSTAPLIRKISGKQAPAYLHTRAEAEQKLLQSNVEVAALIDRPAAMTALYRYANANPLNMALGLNARLDDIARYATETGGPVLRSNSKQAAEKLATLLDELRQRYTLGYTPTTAKPAGTFCKISLRFTPAALAAHPELRHDEIRTRTGYYR